MCEEELCASERVGVAPSGHVAPGPAVCSGAGACVGRGDCLSSPFHRLMPLFSVRLPE